MPAANCSTIRFRLPDETPIACAESVVPADVRVEPGWCALEAAGHEVAPDPEGEHG